MTAKPFFTILPAGPSSTVQSSSESPRVAANKTKPNKVSFVMIDDYLIDVTINEDHRFESEITEYPVESGSSVSDNIRPKPLVVTMEGLVSNTPLADMAKNRGIIPPAEAALSALGSAGAGALRRASSGVKTSEEAYAHFLKIWDRREPVTIRTSLGTFENMALESLSFPRTGGEHDGLRFSASFKQIKIVSNKRVKVAIPIATGGGTDKPKTKPLEVVDKRAVQYVNLDQHTWFDRDINGWREGATYPTLDQHQKQLAAGQPMSQWKLYKNRPLCVTRAQWSRWLNPPDAPPNVPNFSGNPNFNNSAPLEADYSDASVRTINEGLLNGKGDHDLGPGGPWASIKEVSPPNYTIIFSLKRNV